MKTLQEYVRKKCIEAKHGLPYEEGLLKEPDWVTDEGDECYRKPIISLPAIMQALDVNFKKREKEIKKKGFQKHLNDVITTGKILKYPALTIMGYFYDLSSSYAKDIYGIHWKFFKEGKELYFEEQSEETQRSIAELLGFKE